MWLKYGPGDGPIIRIIQAGPMQAQGPYKREAADQLVDCNVMRGEDGKWEAMGGHEPKSAGSLQQLKKAKKYIFYKSLQKEHSPADKLILDLWPPEL